MTGVPWRKGEPSRPTASCVRCDRAGCGDTDCSNRVAFLCRIPAGRPLLRLRGLCLETGLETAYYPDIRPPLIDAGGSSQGSTELVWIGHLHPLQRLLYAVGGPTIGIDCRGQLQSEPNQPPAGATGVAGPE